MKILIWSVLLLNVLCLACSRGSDSSIVASYGDGVIRADDFRKLYHMRMIDDEAPVPRSEESEREQKMAVLDEMITHRLLLDQARQQGITIDSDQLQNYLKRIRNGYDGDNFKEHLAHRGVTIRDWEENQQERFLVQEWIRRTLVPTLRVTAAEIKAYYQGHGDEFVIPERVRALHIVVPSAEQAEQIKEGLAAGKDFATLAHDLSHGPEADQGGDLGYFARDETMPLFAETCFGLDVGEVSDVVVSDYGFHIFKVVDKKPRRKKSLSQAEEEIRQRLQVERIKEMTADYVNNLRQDVEIRINEDVLMEVQ